MPLITPNMNLPVPNVGTTQGPEYAQNVNDSLTLLDRHDHTNGQGVPITPLAMNINTDLTMNENALLSAKFLNMTAQVSTPMVTSVYAKGVDLYFVDGNGNDIRVTQSGGIAGSPGSISNLTAPASVSYVSVSKTFVFQSDTSIAANLDAASILLRNISPNSNFALTLQPPSGMAANSTITLPTIPAATAFVTIDTAGSLAGSVPLALGITASMLAADSVTTSKIQDNAVTTAKMLNKPALVSTVFPTDGTFVVPSTVNNLIVTAWGGAGGGGGGFGGSGGPTLGGAGGGGAGGGFLETVLQVTPGETITVTIGSGGPGAAISVTGTGANGTSGGQTVISGTFGSVFAPGGNGGFGGSAGTSTSAPGGAQAVIAGSANSPGGQSTYNGPISNGTSSIRAAGGAAGTISGGVQGGGGGGAGLGTGGNGGGGASATPATNGGIAAGGGGGFASSGAPGGAGGNGGSGQVRISYITLV